MKRESKDLSQSVKNRGIFPNAPVVVWMRNRRAIPRFWFPALECIPKKFIGERDELVIVSLAMMPLLIVNMNVNRSLPGDFTSIVMILSFFLVTSTLQVKSVVVNCSGLPPVLPLDHFFADIG